MGVDLRGLVNTAQPAGPLCVGVRNVQIQIQILMQMQIQIQIQMQEKLQIQKIQQYCSGSRRTVLNVWEFWNVSQTASSLSYL